MLRFLVFTFNFPLLTIFQPISTQTRTECSNKCFTCRLTFMLLCLCAYAQPPYEIVTWSLSTICPFLFSLRLCFLAPLRYAFHFFSLRAWHLGGSILVAFMAALAKVAQRRIAPLFSPHLRQLGGASRASRRFLRHKILDLAARPVLPAAHLGGSFANAANFNAICNTRPPKNRGLSF